MKALVYHGPGRATWEDKPRPYIHPKALISHHFKLTDIEEAYAAFGNAGKTGVLKVILQRT